MKALWCATLMLALGASAAAAQTSLAPNLKSPAPAPSAVSQKLVCHREADTGSLLAAHKICHTQAEWDAISHDASDQVRSTQLNSSHMRSGNG